MITWSNEVNPTVITFIILINGQWRGFKTLTLTSSLSTTDNDENQQSTMSAVV